jgi:F420-dependent oxidoreductase-like protein
MTAHPVRFGIQTGQQMIEWQQMLDLWKKADAWGYDSLWAFDHFYPIFVDPEGPCLEGLTTLAALAQATTRARVGHLVLGNTYRHPAITAKAACTLDHISGGRFNLGIGAGWFELEHTTLGIDFKTVGGRLQALEESLQIIKGMFTGHKTTVHGRHYRVTDALCLPKAVQKPHPPIMIGGVGEKVLLRIVAQYADMWNAFAPPEEMARLGAIIDRHGEAVGRDARAIERTIMMPLCYTENADRQNMVCNIMAMTRQTTPDQVRGQIMLGGTQQCLDTVERYRKVGVTHFIFMMFAPYYLDEVQAFAEEVAPVFR